LHGSGKALRRLRTERGLSIEDLAYKADITPLALSNIELKSAKPQRETLIRILIALEAASSVPVLVRRELLELHGYTDAPSVPNQTDIDRAVEVWQAPFKDAPFPAYLVDFTQRIHDWNDQALVFVGKHKEDLAGFTLFDLLFSPQTRGMAVLENEEEIVTKTVAHMREEYLPFAGTEWCTRLLNEQFSRYPRFKHLYDTVPPLETQSIDIRGMEPAIFSGPEGTSLKFRIVGIDIVSDPRFRAVQYVPLDSQTMQVMTQLLSKER